MYMKTKFIGMFLLAAFAFTAMPVFATGDTNATSTGSTSTSSTATLNEGQKIKAAQVNLECMQNAVDARDTAIITALDAFHASAKSALETRKAALKTAWGITDRLARRTALKTAWNAYISAMRAARKTFRDARMAAWKAFNVGRKACGRGHEDDRGAEGYDNQL